MRPIEKVILTDGACRDVPVPIEGPMTAAPPAESAMSHEADHDVLQMTPGRGAASGDFFV